MVSFLYKIEVKYGMKSIIIPLCHNNIMKISRIYSVLPFLLLLVNLSSKVLAADDDESIASEIAMDLVVGIAISVCEQYATCKAFMIIGGIIAFIITLTALCNGTISCEDICNGRSARRGFTTGVGYGIGRRLRR